MKSKKIMAKTLTLAVMLSLMAGQAYAAGSVDIYGKLYPEINPDSNYGGIQIYDDSGTSNGDKYSSLGNTSLEFYDDATRGDGSLASYSYWGVNLFVPKKDDPSKSGHIVYLGEENDSYGVLRLYNPENADDTDSLIKLSYRDGLDMGEKKIKDLADGTVSSTSKEAVTGSQLYETQQSIAAKANAADVYTKTETDTLLNAKADKATTLAGYGITDAYTKTETDTLLNAKADKTTLTAEVNALRAEAVASAAALETKFDAKLGTPVDGNYIKASNNVAQNLSALDNQVKTNADAITAEEAARIAADTTLQTNIDNEEAARIAADNTLQTNIDNEATARQNADTILQTNIDNEATARQNADTTLQTNIDNEEAARIQGDADTLKAANEYTDNEISKISSGLDEGVKNLTNKINQTNDRVDRVGATAAALAGIHYQPMTKGQSQVAVGMGGYKGKKATALGYAYQINDRVSGSISGAANGSEHMFNVGFNYLFGQHSNKDIAQCAATPGSMSLKEAELQSQVDSLNAKVARLEAMVQALTAK